MLDYSFYGLVYALLQNINQNQLINAKFEALATNPTTGNFEGRMYFNTATFTLMVYANAGWKKSVHSIVSGGGAGIAEALTVSESNGTVTLSQRKLW